MTNPKYLLRWKFYGFWKKKNIKVRRTINMRKYREMTIFLLFLVETIESNGGKDFCRTNYQFSLISLSSFKDYLDVMVKCHKNFYDERVRKM